jgi:hypothetical protein
MAFLNCSERCSGHRVLNEPLKGYASERLISNAPNLYSSPTRHLIWRLNDQGEGRVRKASPHLDVGLGHGKKSERVHIPARFGHVPNLVPSDFVNAHLD